MGLFRQVGNAALSSPLKRRYLEFFFQTFVVRNRKIVRAVPTDFFQILLRSQRVQTRANWWTRLNVNLTALIRLLGDPAWVEKQRELLAATLPV